MSANTHNPASDLTHTVQSFRFLVRISYLELYNEEVRDLLSKTPQKKLDVRERPDIGVYVKDLSSFVVKNADEMDKLMSIGAKNSNVQWPCLVS